MSRRPRVPLLGVLTQMPVAGAIWQNIHFLRSRSRALAVVAGSNGADPERDETGAAEGNWRLSGNGNASLRRAELRARLTTLRQRALEGGIGDLSDLGASKEHAYDAMILRLRALVDSTLPTDAHVLVVSKGDSELLRLGPRQSSHFPQTETGTYAGHHPADGAAARMHLDQLRRRGADYLVVPRTSFWWLDYYREFHDELEHACTLLAGRDDTGRIYALSEKASARALPSGAEVIELDATPKHQDEHAQDEIEVRVEVAELLRRQGSMDEAVDVLTAGFETERDPQLLIALVRCERARGNRTQAQRYAAEVIERVGSDYRLNLELAHDSWAAGQLSAAAQLLTQLARDYPEEDDAANDLVRLYCSQIEQGGEADLALSQRFVTSSCDLREAGRLLPGTLLRASEVLASLRRSGEALACLDDALSRRTFEDAEIRDFTARLLRRAVPAAPFDDPRTLSPLLTHAGNGFLAVNDQFRAEACWRLARAALGRESAAAFNLAWRAVDDGEPLAAFELLASVTRIFSEEASLVCWPRVDGQPWPYATLPAVDSFERLKPVDSTWPRITVVTPSFQQAAYVEQTILSVLNQNYPDLEYIVVDGASSDGTADVLQRYEHRLSHLIVEPDGGQSEAINKGLALATGELVLWVNSDDMLGPGALFAAAAAYLTTDADIVAGFCCEHSDRRFGLINLPAATPASFNLGCLGDLFEYWLKGHFFYQPEVIFTRRILERVGGSLREDLEYTMDYDFWLRCAAAGGSVTVIRWPIGLFRKHELQKTSDLGPAVIEQGKVRDGFIVPRPSFERTLQIGDRLRQALSKPSPRIAVVSARAEKIFSADTPRELAEVLAAEGIDATFDDALDLDRDSRADLLIVLLHLKREHEALRRLREAGSPVPVIGWSWDNHHHVFANYRSAADVDVLVPGHAFASAYLRSPRYALADPLPLCATQWTAAEAARFFARYGSRSRSDALYGGFVRYVFSTRRNRFIEDLQEAGMDSLYLLPEDVRDEYFGLSPEERFAQWAARKASLCLPLSGDLSQRFFDALLTGQVPVVPHDVFDLDQVIPRRLQRELPVVRFGNYSVAAVRRAHRRAIAAFDAGGTDGAARRHQYALENHLFANRVSQLLTLAGAIP